jgi:nucleoside-diphosphate-sugar epimerase
MNILITGCLGHIGSSLIKHFPLIRPDLNIFGIDNLSTQRYNSLFNLPKKKFYFIEADIRKYNFDELLSSIDIVIHLAAITDASSSFEKAKEVEENNFKSTQVIAEACSRSLTPLIFVSSTSVYGSQREIVDEDCNIAHLNPQSPYAETKIKEEKFLKDLSENSGSKITCCRFGTIFGVSNGMRFHTAVNKFCWQAAYGQKLTVWKTAYRQVRPYLSLLDATRVFDHIISKNLFQGYQLYNVVTDNFTVEKIIETIKCYFKEVEIEFVDSKIMNQLSYKVLSQKIINTGFHYKGSLSESVHETYNLLIN